MSGQAAFMPASLSTPARAAVGPVDASWWAHLLTRVCLSWLDLEPMAAGAFREIGGQLDDSRLEAPR